MNWELFIFYLFREQVSSMQENLVIFPSLFQDLCDMLVANRLYPKLYDLAYNSLSVILV